jgi:heme-degrading monooxygenase HmoA
VEQKMNKVLVAAELYVDILEFTEMHDWLRSVIDERLEGLKSIELWRKADEPGRYLVLSEYSRGGASEDALQWMADNLLVSRLQSKESVPTVLCAAVRHSLPRQEGACWMSWVNAWAAGGYEEEKLEELQNILSDLSYLPGFAGSLLGTDISTPSQVLSLAFWADPESFATSMPGMPAHEVRLYEKVQI